MSDHPSLEKSVPKLREELTAYRWLLEDYLRKGSRAFLAAIVALALLLVMTVTSFLTMQHTSNLVDRIAESEQRHIADVEEHRHRNEMLHACLAELILEIVRTSPDGRNTIENPCPEPLFDGDGHD